MSRHDTLFSIRYAVRVLERYARFWSNINTAARLGSLLAGSAAIAALSATHTAAALVAGIFFALLQGVEFAMYPAGRAAEALAQRRPYADLYARQSAISDDQELEGAYQALVAADELVMPEHLKHLAYNDVVAERGCDPTQLYPLRGFLMRCYGLLA